MPPPCVMSLMSSVEMRTNARKGTYEALQGRK